MFCVAALAAIPVEGGADWEATTVGDGLAGNGVGVRTVDAAGCATDTKGRAVSGGGRLPALTLATREDCASATFARAVSVPRREGSVFGNFIASGILATVAFTSACSRAFLSRRFSDFLSTLAGTALATFVPKG